MFFFTSAFGESAHVSLAGRWRLQLDPQNVGVNDRRFSKPFSQPVDLPGSLPEQGIGELVSLSTKWMGTIQDPNWFKNPIYAAYTNATDFKFPFWLQPKTYFAGSAWYQRQIVIPKGWRNKRVLLFLERPHWETLVWLDDQLIGTNDSLSTPHEYELGLHVSPGPHRLTIRVDNSLVVDVGVNSHSITDHTQGNWNGIVGIIELRACDPVWIDNLQIFPDRRGNRVAVRAVVHNPLGLKFSGNAEFLLRAKGDEKILGSRSEPIETDASDFPIEITIAAEAGLKSWDECTPELYTLECRLTGISSNTPLRSAICSSFGMREVGTEGTQFTINNRNTFIRGTLECCIFPKTGHPPTDVGSWKRIIHICKEHGLNLIRFHSWCPPEAAFVAADELGFYYQVEIASWANQSTTLGDGKPVDAWLYKEADRILRAYGNHPSFLLMPYGNEPGGKNCKDYLAKWVEHWKQRDSRRLYTSGSGWPQIPENQFHVTPDPRLQAWGGGLKSRINYQPPETSYDYRDYIQARSVPVISHEIGQWCVYPNFAERRKYTGYLKPKNFDIFEHSLIANHMGGQAKEFLLASGKLQALCYKEDIEAALRTPGMGGFELLDLHDFPGQGTALVGTLDPFWEDKGYITARQFRRFCNSTVPLARLPKRVFTTDETLSVQLEVAHFGADQLRGAVPSWKIVSEKGQIISQGELTVRDIPIGNGTSLGSFTISLTNFPSPARYRLVVSIYKPGNRHSVSQPEAQEADLRAENDWDFWVYPPARASNDAHGIHICSALDQLAVSNLNAGRSVLLLIPPNRVRGDHLGKVALGFSSIFWNTAWTHRQAPHTLGILCDPAHPALASFPTDYHSNWQWWYIVTRAGATILDDLPPDIHPIVQVIDDWVTNRRLALVFEAKVGRGKLLVTSIDLTSDFDHNPVARQLRQSLLSYMAGPRFNPKTSVSVQRIQSLMTDSSVAHNE